MASPSQEFELVFEGVVDDSPDTLRRVKGILIADLELSIEDVQRALTAAPVAIKCAASERDLQGFLRTLKNAGGKVLIASRAGAAPEEEPAADEDGGFTIDLSEIGIKPGVSKSKQIEEPSTIHVLPDIEDTESIFNAPEFKSEPEVLETPVEVSSDESEPAATPPVDDAKPLFSFADSEEAVETPPVVAAPSAAADAFDMAKPLFDLGDPLDIEPEEATGPVDPKADESESLFSDLELAPAEVEAPAKSPAPTDPPKNPVAHLMEEDPLPTPAAAPAPNLELAGKASLEAAEALREIAKFKDLLGDDEPVEKAAQPETPPPTPPKIEKAPVKGPLQPSTVEFSLSIEEEEPPAKESAPKAPPVSEDLTLAPEEAPPPPTSAPRAKSEGPAQPKASPKKASHQPAATPPPTKKAEPAPVVASAPEPPVMDEVQEIAESFEEAAAAEQESPPVRRSRGLAAKLHLDIVVPAVVGCLILGFANYLYFSGEKKVDMAGSLDDAIRSAAEKAAPAAKQPTGPVATIVEGTTTTQGIHLKASFTVVKDTISGYLVELTTPQPPALTPEQIVNQVVQEPWLRKVEIRDLKLKWAEDGTFSAEGPVRSFVEYKNDRLRVVSKGIMTGAFNKETKAISIKVFVSTGYDTLPTGLGAEIKAVDGGKFKLFASAETTATALAVPGN